MDFTAADFAALEQKYFNNWTFLDVVIQPHSVTEVQITVF